MENYKLHFDENDRDAVISILSRNNDVVINTIEPTTIGITIQQDDARNAYFSLLNEIERELKGPEGGPINRQRPEYL